MAPRRRPSTPRLVLDLFACNRRTFDIKCEIEKSLNSSFLLVAQRAMASRRQLDRYARLLAQYFNDRVAWLWTLRDDESRMTCIFVLYHTVLRCLEQAKEMVSSNRNNNKILAVFQQFQLALEAHFPSKLMFVLTHYTRRNVFVWLDKVFEDSKYEFCRMRTRWRLALVSCQKIAPNREHSENDLYKMLQEVGLNPVLTSMERAIGVAPVRFRPLLSTAVDAVLEALLDAILHRQLAFDESGLYKLFRLLLKLREFVEELKQRLNLPKEDRLMQDLTTWRRAQFAIDEINDAIFEGKKAKFKPTAVSEGSRSEWKNIVNHVNEWIWLQRWQQWQKRHKGTVFVSLSLDVHEL